MKKLLLLSLVLCSGLFCQAQTELEPRRFGIKLQTRLNLNFTIGRSVNVNGIHPALQIQTPKGFIHHIEISELGIGNFSFNNTDSRNYFLAAGYEFSVPLSLFLNNEEMKAYLGLGLNTSASSFLFSPAAANQFQQSGNFYVASFYLLPSLQRNITDRLFFDFALLATFGEVSVTNSNTSDPSVPVGQRSFNQVDREFFSFDQLSFRFGFGIRL